MADREYPVKVILDTSSLNSQIADLKVRLAQISQDLRLQVYVNTNGLPRSGTGEPLGLGQSVPNTMPRIPKEMYEGSRPQPPSNTTETQRRLDTFHQSHVQTPNATPSSSVVPVGSAYTTFNSPATEELSRILGQILPKGRTQYNSNLTDQAKEASAEANSLYRRSSRMYYRAQEGYRPTPATLDTLKSRIDTQIKILKEMYREETRGNLAPERLLNRATKLGLELSELTSEELTDDQLKANRPRVVEINKQLNKIQAAHKSHEILESQMNNLVSAQEMTGNIAPRTLASQIPQHLKFAGKMLSAIIPGFDALIGLGVFKNSYSLASEVGVDAGKIGMQAGGISPNTVYSSLTSRKFGPGFSPGQVTEALSMQGQFSGTANFAFLFKDASQTAQFARYLGISTQTGAQIMSGYQLAGAFAPGQETKTKNQIMNAVAASGMNSSAFATGLNTLTQESFRSSLFQHGGPAVSLSLLSQLGNNMGISLFQGPNAAQSLLTMQQGFASGPGVGSGLTASYMAPIYQAVNAVNAPSLKKMGITNPMMQMAISYGTPIYDDSNRLSAFLTGVHKALASARSNPNLFSQEEVGFANTLFGSINQKSVESINKLAGPGFTKQLAKVQTAIKKAHSDNAESYMGSMAESLQVIKQVVQHIELDIGGALIPIVRGIAGVLNVAIPASAVGFAAAAGSTNALAYAGLGIPLGEAARKLAQKVKEHMKKPPRGGPPSGGASASASPETESAAHEQAKSDAADQVKKANVPIGNLPFSTQLALSSKLALHTALEGNGVIATTETAAVAVAAAIGAIFSDVPAYAATLPAKSHTSALKQSTHDLKKFDSALKQSTQTLHEHSTVVAKIVGTGGSFPSNGIVHHFLPNVSVTTAQQQRFVHQLSPLAAKAAKTLGVPVTDVLSQWAYETKWGTSPAYLENHNLGGIGQNGIYGPGADKSYAGYPSLSAAASDYAQVLRHSRYHNIHNKPLSPFGYGYVLTKDGYDTSSPFSYGSGLSADAAAIRKIQQERKSLKHNLNRKKKKAG